jgi:hypothetical protein
MSSIGQQLANSGWILRSGFADGADMAFCRGADYAAVNGMGGQMEIYIPWVGFNGAPRDHEAFIVPDLNRELVALAREYHPAWHRCAPGAKRLHARNGCQILGSDLKTPADMVICWTAGGQGGGGTGQALRLARAYNVPIFDLAIEGIGQKLCEFVNQKEYDNHADHRAAS